MSAALGTSLKNRVVDVQQASRRLVRLHGLARWLIVAVGSLALFGLLDFLLRPTGFVIRWLFSLTVAACWGWAFFKWVLPALQQQDDLVAVAQRIEQHFRPLQRQLSSAIAFLEQEPTARASNSGALRCAAVAQTEALAQRLDFRAALDDSRPWRAARRAALAAGAVALLAVCAPNSARLAVQRLAMPWRQLAWPRRHELVLVNPVGRVAMGDAWEVAVVDRRGNLPGAVQLFIRTADSGAGPHEAHDMQQLDERMVYRMEKVTRSFEYRVRGGDDNSMPWTEVAVLEPPKLIELIVEVLPPPYSGLPPRREGRVVKALVGSRLQVRGRFDKPIRNARIRSETPEFSVPEAALVAEGREFVVPKAGGEWTVDRSGSLAFEFTDLAGLKFGRDTRIEIQAIQDSPPAIAWEKPADPTAVVTQAVVQVRGTVKDDLSVRHVQLRFQRAGEISEAEAVTLFVADASGSPTASGDAMTGESRTGESRAFDFSWGLSQLPGVQAGDEFLLSIEATDSRDQVASTEQRRMSIITHEDLLRRIHSRLATVLERLADALRAQRQVRDGTQQLHAEWQQSPAAAAAFHELAALQHRQRQVEEAIGPGTGATVELGALHQEMIVNRTDQEPLGLKAAGMLGQLETLNAQALPAIELQLAEALQFGRQAEAPEAAPANASHGDPPVGALAAAAREQSTVVRVLEEIVGELAEWDDLSRIAVEVRRIGQEQSNLIDATTAQRNERLASQGEPSAEARTKAQQLADQQTSLALQIDKLQLRLGSLAETRQQPEGRESLPAASRTAERLAIGAQMRAAAEQLLRGELGKALATEMAAAEALQQLQSAISPASAESPDQSAVDKGQPPASGQGESLAAELQALKAMQEDLNKRTQAADSASDSRATTEKSRREEATALARQQGRLAELTQELLKRMSKSTESETKQP